VCYQLGFVTAYNQLSESTDMAALTLSEASPCYHPGCVRALHQLPESAHEGTMMLSVASNFVVLGFSEPGVSCQSPHG